MAFIRNRFILFSFSFGIGFVVIYGQIQKGSDRGPAAVRQYYDFTNLRGSALEIALKERIVSNLEVVKKEAMLGITLGHFAFTNSKTQETFGCNEYDKVILSFESADMAVSGEKSRMEVKSECKASSDITMIEPIWLPLDKIYKDKPTDGNFQFMESQNTSVELSNISDEWPRKWHLVGIQLTNKSTGFSIDRNEVAKILGKPLVLSLPQSAGEP